MKTSLFLGLSFFSMMATGNNYYSIIGNNNFEVIDFPDETIISEWENVGLVYGCNDTIPTDAYYKNVEFTQKEDCNQNQERTITKKKDEQIISEETESQIIKITTERTDYGTHLEDSCKAILDTGFSFGDGIYQILYGQSNWNVFCDMTTDNGGWTLVFKKNSDVALNPAEFWKAESKDGVSIPEYEEYYANNTSIISDRSKQTEDYALPMRMDIQNFSEVRMEINKNNAVKQFIKFSAASDYKDFISQSEIISSSWIDIKTSTYNYFSVDGHMELERRIYLNHSYGGCPADVGWFVALGEVRPTPCSWESGSYKLRYSQYNTKVITDNSDFADNFMIYYR